MTERNDYLGDNLYRIEHGSCLDKIKEVPDNSVNAIVTDPPYAGIHRDYGDLTEEEWHALMNPLLEECRRVLKPDGSAMFLIQPNYKSMGSMSAWVYDFCSHVIKSWNMVQDAYWWNTSSLPVAGANENVGLLNSSMKFCVWAGPADCKKNYKSVLWRLVDQKKTEEWIARAENKGAEPSHKTMSGATVSSYNMMKKSLARGGTWPKNVIPLSNVGHRLDTFKGEHNPHSARTPNALMSWWIKYLTDPGDVVLEPFLGSGTCGVEALRLDRRFIGFEQDDDYFSQAKKRLKSSVARDLNFMMGGSL